MDDYRDTALGVESAWPAFAVRGKKAARPALPWVAPLIAGLIAATALALLS